MSADVEVRRKAYDKRDLHDAFRAGVAHGDSQWTRRHTGLRPTFDEWFEATFATRPPTDDPDAEEGA